MVRGWELNTANVCFTFLSAISKPNIIVEKQYGGQENNKLQNDFLFLILSDFLFQMLKLVAGMNK